MVNTTSIIKHGDWVEVLRSMEEDAAQCVVTSPPYWGMRNYDVDGQFGREPHYQDYVKNLVAGARELKRVLADDGVFWLNLGDCYFSSGGGTNYGYEDHDDTEDTPVKWRAPTPEGHREKNLAGIPWRVALALQEDGWYLRNDIIWYKPNPSPIQGGVNDRCNRAHEHVFLLTQQPQYKFYRERIRTVEEDEYGNTVADHVRHDVWNFNTAPRLVDSHTVGRDKTVHFARFPAELPTRCIRASTDAGDTVLDPFCGAGTTGTAANRIERNFVGIELNERYVRLALDQIEQDAPMFVDAEVDWNPTGSE